MPYGFFLGPSCSALGRLAGVTIAEFSSDIKKLFKTWGKKGEPAGALRLLSMDHMFQTHSSDTRMPRQQVKCPNPV